MKLQDQVVIDLMDGLEFQELTWSSNYWGTGKNAMALSWWHPFFSMFFL